MIPEFKKQWIIISCLLCYFVCLGDIVVLYHFADKFPGYSHLSDLISELGSSYSPVSKLFSIWWIFAGTFFIIFAIGFYYSFREEGKIAGISAWLIILYALGDCVVSGLFKDDHLHGGDADLASTIHVVIGGIGIFALVAFPLSMQKIYTKERNSNFYYLSWVVFYISILTCILLGFRYYYVAYLSDLQGLWQRIMLIGFYTYFITIATMMLKKVYG